MASDPVICSTCKWREARPDRRTCQTCADYQKTQREAHRLRRQAWRAIPENRAAFNAKRNEAHYINPTLWMVQAARRRAKAQGLAFDITTADIVIPAVCPLLETPIIVGRGVQTMQSPSLDRIIPSLGYVCGNVWVISYRANMMKHNGTLEELERLTSNLRARMTARAA